MTFEEAIAKAEQKGYSYSITRVRQNPYKVSVMRRSGEEPVIAYDDTITEAFRKCFEHLEKEVGG